MARNIVVTLECFVKKGNKYLMLHRGAHKRIMPDVWMAAGGHREFNEGLFECARREVLEETGLTIKNIRVRAIGNAYVKDLQQEFFFHMLLADYAGGELKTSDADGTFAWLTKKEIIKLDKLLPELKHIISHILSKSNKIISYKAYYEKGTEMTFIEIENT